MLLVNFINLLIYKKYLCTEKGGSMFEMQTKEILTPNKDEKSFINRK